MKLLIATGNQAKFEELRELLAELDLTLLNLTTFPNIAEVAETGTTFIENASLKATQYSTQTQVMTLADDSGLEVVTLGGAPGVRSARYTGAGGSDLDRVHALLRNLGDNPSRKARFVSAIVIADCRGEILNTSIGICDGKIAHSPRGSCGFGYDPIFVPDGYELTFGELEPEVKNRISHRARALESARSFLQSLTTSSAAG